MDDNPYQSPFEELASKPPVAAAPVAAAPNRHVAVIFAILGALFGFMIVPNACKGISTSGDLLKLGLALSPSVGFFAMASGMWSGKRWPVVVGFLTVFVPVASMLKIVFDPP